MDEQYQFPLSSYMSGQKFERLKRFSEGLETPCLIIDLDVIRANFAALRKELPFASVYYAVKANPNEEVIRVLRDLGSSFDVATRYELDELLRIGGIDPERMSFGNTIKKEKDIAYFYEKGVRVFATDSLSDLEKIARAAPGSKVFFRLLTECAGADWPLSKKFGCQPDIARKLILRARELKLEPYGISFHPGSQQRDISQWQISLNEVASLWSWAKEKAGVEFRMINMGGGFPADYVEPTPVLSAYASHIKSFLDAAFGGSLPEKVIIEPGRSMAGDSGVIVSEIVNIAKKTESDTRDWVYLDIGKFGGLIETLDEAIKYPIYFQGSGKKLPIILAGPTCDSADILYEKYPYFMPESTKVGERVYILTAGAYTQSYSSVYFNGFPPLAQYILK